MKMKTLKLKLKKLEQVCLIILQNDMLLEQICLLIHVL